MIFKRTSIISTSKSVEDIRQSLLGNAVEVHNLKFEFVDKNNMLKIIPKAENDEKLRILPITHLEFNDTQSGVTKIKISSKPRRIDIGGPNLLLVFCFFTIICGLYLFLFRGDAMRIASIVMMIIGGVVFAIFWWRMQGGYFDYVKKLNKFVKDKVGA